MWNDIAKLSQSNRASGRVGADMTDADMPAADAELIRNTKAFAGESNPRLAAGFGEDFDVGPGDAAAPAGAEDFQDGFLGREASRETFDLPFGIAGAILLFERREATIEKTLTVLLDHLANPGRLNNIDTVSDDWHPSRKLGPWKQKVKVRNAAKIYPCPARLAAKQKKPLVCA